MKIGDVPWVLAAGAITAIGAFLAVTGLNQLAAGDDMFAKGLFLVALVSGLGLLFVGLLGLALYVTRSRR